MNDSSAAASAGSPAPFFITTAIDYTNGAPHIGHAYEKVLADVLARYHRLKGEAVFYLTGVDQHGQKVQQSAEKQGVAPQQFVDEVTAKFLALWEKLGIGYDAWAATTAPLHKECVRGILQRLWDEKDPATGKSRWIYKKTEGGWYSVRQEQFLTDKERGEDGEFGVEWQPVEYREEENYYFRLKEHREWLAGFIRARSEEGKPFVAPDFRVAELLNAVEKIEGDLCISRPKARLAWGIEIPFDSDFVTFVWFDALVNYISFAGFDPAGESAEFAARWPALHVIGKDILIPAHGVYWPVMLKALGFADAEQPTLLVHGWWNISGGKMSKSLGNVVDPDALADRYGVAAVRYYLMSDIATGRDADFSEERLVQRFNTDLANGLGNQLNRTLNMAQRYREGRITPGTLGEEKLEAHVALVKRVVAEYGAALDRCEPSAALSLVLEAIRSGDALIDFYAPWKLAKDPEQGAKLDAILATLAESLRVIAILIAPVLPEAAAGIFGQLNWEGPLSLADAEWGRLPAGHVLNQQVPLFPRIVTETK